MSSAKTAAQAKSEPDRRKDRHGHHTIPIALCGAQEQTPSVLDARDHFAFHSAQADFVFAVAVTEERAEAAVLGRHRQEDVVRLANSRVGRQIIADALEVLYRDGGWWHKGEPYIGAVFSRESVRYVDGHTSKSKFCSREGKPMR
jgi:hypothetical protein